MGVLDAFDKEQKELAMTAPLVVFMVDEASRQQVTKALRQLDIREAFVDVGSINDLIAYLGKRERSPERLVVDISGVDKVLDMLDHLADACDPSVTVYAVGDKNDVTLYRLLLQAGITDYRYKPLTVDALRLWLDDTGNYSVRQARSGKIIAVAGARGGVGASTLAGQLARELIAGGPLRKVAFLDMDFYGGAGTTLLGLPVNYAMPEVLGNIDMLDAQFLGRVLTTEDDRLYALGFNALFAQEFVLTPGTVAGLLTALSQHFHYLVVDLPHPGSQVANEVYSRANIVCLVSDTSVHSGKIMTNLITHIRTYNKESVMHVVVNATRPPVKSQVEPAEFSKAVAHPVSITIPYDAKYPVQAEDLGEALPPESQMAKAVVGLARTLTGEALEAEGKNSWWQRLFAKGQ